MDLNTQQKINRYIMYIAVIVLVIMAILTIASAAFGIFRVNTSEKHSKVHPVENRYIPALGGQIAVAYDYPSSDAINDMIAQGYEVVAMVHDDLKDQSIVVYKRVK